MSNNSFESNLNLDNEIEEIRRYMSSINLFKNDYDGLKRETPHLFKCIILLKKYNNLISYIKNFIIRHPKLINQTIKTGQTCLHYAIYFSSMPIYYDVIKILISHEVNLDLCDSDGMTILHYLAMVMTKENQLELLKIFINFGSNVNIQDKNGYTPLHRLLINIISHKQENKQIIKEAIQILINAGTILNLQDKSGFNVMHLLGARYEVCFIGEILNDLIKINSKL